MGIALWIATGCAAFAMTRPVGLARTRWSRELAASIVTAVGLGIAATALDFGGWNEPDWRAGLFTGLGALAAVAAVRLASLTRPAVSHSASPDRAKR